MPLVVGDGGGGAAGAAGGGSRQQRGMPPLRRAEARSGGTFVLASKVVVDASWDTLRQRLRRGVVCTRAAKGDGEGNCLCTRLDDGVWRGWLAQGGRKEGERTREGEQ